MPKQLILDPSEYDLNHVMADIEEIRRYNRQRHEMEQLTAVVFEDPERCICVGYKDLRPNEFWVRGHMPGMPLMPGVIMCEAAAQLASYYTLKYRLMAVGGGGLRRAEGGAVSRRGAARRTFRGRGPKLLKAAASILTCQFQCLVRETRLRGGADGHSLVEGDDSRPGA